MGMQRGDMRSLHNLTEIGHALQSMYRLCNSSCSHAAALVMRRSFLNNDSAKAHLDLRPRFVDDLR